MMRKIVCGAAVAALLLTTGSTAMAADWRWQKSSESIDVLDAECKIGLRFGGWDQCKFVADYRIYHLYVR
ncbi:hypothetical protein SAMN05216553_110218 [Lentzea fradiae]|uniref:Uncharacterized protein n=1 Tax=Lentzea fradiae TaxID=200378 RepID=A0A1G7W8A1_9PSEU|nr:hypothetical protein [Lentzea fradiae]SDG68168.1 hypothetical protein SAMN05216553_110218 [Lentzea fradiae]